MEQNQSFTSSSISEEFDVLSACQVPESAVVDSIARVQATANCSCFRDRAQVADAVIDCFRGKLCYHQAGQVQETDSVNDAELLWSSDVRELGHISGHVASVCAYNHARDGVDQVVTRGDVLGLLGYIHSAGLRVGGPQFVHLCYILAKVKREVRDFVFGVPLTSLPVSNCSIRRYGIDHYDRVAGDVWYLRDDDEVGESERSSLLVNLASRPVEPDLMPPTGSPGTSASEYSALIIRIAPKPPCPGCEAERYVLWQILYTLPGHVWLVKCGGPAVLRDVWRALCGTKLSNPAAWLVYDYSTGCERPSTATFVAAFVLLDSPYYVRSRKELVPSLAPTRMFYQTSVDVGDTEEALRGHFQMGLFDPTIHFGPTVLDTVDRLVTAVNSVSERGLNLRHSVDVDNRSDCDVYDYISAICAVVAAYRAQDAIQRILSLLSSSMVTRFASEGVSKAFASFQAGDNGAAGVVEALFDMFCSVFRIRLPSAICVATAFARSINSLLVLPRNATAFVTFIGDFIADIRDVLKRFLFGTPSPSSQIEEFVENARSALSVPLSEWNTPQKISELKALLDGGYAVALANPHPLIQRTLASLERLHLCVVAHYKNSGMRMKPLTIGIIGKTKIGKTTLVSVLANDLNSKLELGFDPSVLLYTNDGNNSGFMNGYRGQMVYWMDELFSTTNSERIFSETEEFFKVVNVSPYLTNQAAVEDKGTVYFTSPIVMFTTNRTNFDDSQGHARCDSNALMRRVDFILEPELNDKQVPGDGSINRNAWSFRVWDNRETLYRSGAPPSSTHVNYSWLLEMLVSRFIKMRDEHANALLAISNEISIRDVRNASERVNDEVRELASQSFADRYLAMISCAQANKWLWRGRSILDASTSNFDRVCRVLGAFTLGYGFVLISRLIGRAFDKAANNSVSSFLPCPSFVSDVRVPVPCPASVPDVQTINIIDEQSAGVYSNGRTRSRGKTNKISRQLFRDYKQRRFEDYVYDECDAINVVSSAPVATEWLKSKIPTNLSICIFDINGVSHRTCAFFLDDRTFFVNTHVLRDATDLSLFLRFLNGTCLTVELERVVVYEADGSDACLVVLPSPVKGVVKTADALPSTRQMYPGFDYVTTVRLRGQDAKLLNAGPSTHVLVDEVISGQQLVGGFSYTAHCESERGDCGSPYVVVVGGRPTLLGFHFGEIAGEQRLVVVTSDFYRATKPAEFQALPAIQVPERIFVRTLAPDEATFLPHKSALRESGAGEPFVSMSGGVHRRAPAPLVPTPAGSPIENAIAKFDTDNFPIPSHILHAPIVVKNPRRLTTLEALNGIEDPKEEWEARIEPIDIHTSAGYTWRHRPGNGKSFLFTGAGSYRRPTDEFVAAIDSCEEQLHKGPISLIAMDFLKDELRPWEKVESANTRVISVLPVEFNVVMRKYYGALIGSAMVSNSNQHIAVGINPHGPEWSRLYKRLSRFNHWICGDFSGFDRTISRDFFYGFARLVNTSVEDSKVAYNIACSLADVEHRVSNVAYRVGHGNPSGQPATTIFNSYVNSCMINYAMRKMGFRSNEFDYVVYGDDNIIATKRPADFAELQKIMAEYGFRLTRDKEGEDRRFLKRAFVVSGRDVFAPLPQYVLSDMLLWYRTRPDMTSGQAIYERAYMAALESFHHGPEFYRNFVASVNVFLKSIGQPVILKTWEYFYSRFKDDKLSDVVDAAAYDSDDWSRIQQFIVRESGTMQSGEERTAEAGPTQEPGAITVVDLTTIEENSVSRAEGSTSVPRVETALSFSSVAEQLQRPYVVGTYEWNGSAAFGSILAAFDFPDVLFRQQRVMSLLSRYVYFRAGVTVEVRVNTNRFQYGSLLLSALPCSPSYTLGNNDLMRCVNTLNTTDDCGVLSRDRTCTEALMCPHVFVNAHENATASLHLDYTFPLPWLDIVDIMGQYNQSSNVVYRRHAILGQAIGKFVLRVLCPLMSPADSPYLAARVQVIARFTNVDLKGPGYSEYTAFQYGVSDIVRDAESVLRLVPKVAALFSKPTVSEPSRDIALRIGATMSQFDTSDPAPVLGQKPALAEAPTFHDPVDFRSLLALEVPRGFFQFSSASVPGARLATIPLGPVPIVRLRTKQTTSIEVGYSICGWDAYYGELFSYWRGDIVIRLHAWASPFHQCRLLLVWHPKYENAFNPDTMAYGDLLTHQVVIETGDIDVEFRIPFCQSTEYLPTVRSIRTGSRYIFSSLDRSVAKDAIWNADSSPMDFSAHLYGECSNGFLSVYCLNSPSVVSTTNVTPIVCYLSQRIENGQFYGYVGPNSHYLGVTGAPNFTPGRFESGEVGVDETKSDENDTVISLTKRFYVASPAVTMDNSVPTIFPLNQDWAVYSMATQNVDSCGIGIPRLTNASEYISVYSTGLYEFYTSETPSAGSKSTFFSWPFDSLMYLCGSYQFWRGSVRYKARTSDGTAYISQLSSRTLTITPGPTNDKGTHAQDFDAGFVMTRDSCYPFVEATIPWSSALSFCPLGSAALCRATDLGYRNSISTREEFPPLPAANLMLPVFKGSFQEIYVAAGDDFVLGGLVPPPRVTTINHKAYNTE